jgi:glycyl-tRNA synthetase
MSSEEQDATKLQDELDALNAQITKQGSAVRQLKKGGAAAEAIEEAVKALQALKISASGLSEKVESSAPKFNRKAFDELVVRKMFVVPSFEIHGGVKGLYDLGPPACGLKVGSLWMCYIFLNCFFRGISHICK